MREDILGQSQHYAGVSFDVGQRLSQAERNVMRNKAITSGVWSFVEPAYLTPTWVWVDLVSLFSFLTIMF